MSWGVLIPLSCLVSSMVCMFFGEKLNRGAFFRRGPGCVADPFGIFCRCFFNRREKEGKDQIGKILKNLEKSPKKSGKISENRGKSGKLSKKRTIKEGQVQIGKPPHVWNPPCLAALPFFANHPCSWCSFGEPWVSA